MKTGFYGTMLIATIWFTSGCTKNEPIPVASFDYSGTNEFFVPCEVQFSNQSSEAFSYEWWFGNDSSVYTLDPPTSILQNPSTIYRKPGTYSVTLRAYTESRKEWATTTKSITVRDTVR